MIIESKIVIFVYDINDESSFIELNYWIKTAKEILGKEGIYGIAGNKSDLFEYTKVSDEEGKKYAKENDALFFITSAKVDRMGFQRFIIKLVEKYIENNIDKVSKEKNGKKLNLKNTKKKEKKSPSLSHNNFHNIAPPLIKYINY